MCIPIKLHVIRDKPVNRRNLLLAAQAAGSRTSGKHNQVSHPWPEKTNRLDWASNSDSLCMEALLDDGTTGA